MKIEFDWTETSPRIREAIDKVFAASELCRISDNASCGWFTIDVEEDEAPEILNKFSSELEKAANEMRNCEV
jgi:hypothetical protein